MNVQDAATALGLSVRQLWTLMANPQAAAITNDGTAFHPGAVSALAGLLNSARGNGWQLTDAELSSGDLGMMAGSVPRPGYFQSPPRQPFDPVE